MSYISAETLKNDVIVWERHSPDSRDIIRYPAPYYFYIEDPNGTYKTMYGDKVEKVEFPSSKEFYSAKKQCKINGWKMFESDIQPDLKILSSKYYNVPAPKPNVTFFDIEVDYDPVIGFADIINPYAPINSIALYQQWTNTMLILAVPPETYSNRDTDVLLQEMNEVEQHPDDWKIDIQLFKNETDLLLYFLDEIDNADILSGWNSEFFDIPYIAMRILKILDNIDVAAALSDVISFVTNDDSPNYDNEGANNKKLMTINNLIKRGKHFNRLSFDLAKPPSWRIVERFFGAQAPVLDLHGRVTLDYLDLFKKFEMDERPSYKLESIADEILPDLPKLNYPGTLATLYRDNFPYFIRYNLRDTEDLKGFEDRLGYVEVANQMAHLSTGKFTHVAGTLKLAELATINYCHHELGNLIVNDNTSEDGRRIKGAFVLVPQIGVHDYVGSVDIASLYPSSIRSVNISPETLIGQFVECVAACEAISHDPEKILTFEFNNIPTDSDDRFIQKTAKEWRDYLLENNWTVSGYGTVFSQDKEGIIPSILANWYDTRKHYQRKKKDAITARDELLATYYDKLQYIYKIKLNSFYGALSNNFFRFFDTRLSESTTGTGRMILLHQCAEVIKLLDGEYAKPDVHYFDDKGREHFGFSDKYSLVYGDTDSAYFNTHTTSTKDAITVADTVGKLVNKSFPNYMRNTFLCNSQFDNIIKTGREIVADRGIFVNKKRYILHIVDNEGQPCDKMKVMGLDTKKTTLPRFISKKLNSYIERYLKREPWGTIAVDIVDYKTYLYETADTISIGLPKGIQKIEAYTRAYNNDNTTRLPGHVAAAIYWNMMLDIHKDTESLKIISGMKIKIFYLNQKYERFHSIAIPGDITTLPVWFIKNIEPIISKEKQIVRLIDNPLENILKAVDIPVPSKQSLFIDSMLEF